MKVKSLSFRRLIILVAGLVGLAVLLLAGAFSYFSYSGPPDTLFFRRTARRFCVRCGTQGIVHSRVLLDRSLQSETPVKIVAVPKIESRTPPNCAHSFQTIAVRDRYLSFDTLRWTRWGFGKLEGDPFWSTPSLVSDFAALSRSAPQEADTLFAYLNGLYQNGRVPDAIRTALDGTNTGCVIQAIHTDYTNAGFTLPNLSQQN